MDKKLLDSLGNLSLALEDIADALKSKSEAKTATAKALKGGDFIKEIKEIQVGVKQLQKDTKKILANQETIIRLSKQKKEQTQAEKLGGDKKGQNNFKDGIKVILLIAVAVLAIGAAFKILGNVNFLSVLALAIALPLLAIAFEKIFLSIKKTGFNVKRDSVNFIGAVVSLAVAITLSSFILNMIKPVGFTKMLTAILIGAGFALMAPTIGKLIRALGGLKWSGLAKVMLGLTLILPAISLGIMLSSRILGGIKPIGVMQLVTMIGIAVAFTIIAFGLEKLLGAFKNISPLSMLKAQKFLPRLLAAVALGIALSSAVLMNIKPVGFLQLLTAIGIAAVFSVASFGFAKMITAFDKISPAEAIVAQAFLPLLLIAFSYAMSVSSKYFARITPISFPQFLTALGIAAVFVVMSFGMKMIIRAIAKMKWTDVPKLPVFFTLISISIYASSQILSKTVVIPFMTMLKILVFSVVLGVVAIALGFTMWLLNKMNIGYKNAIQGGFVITAMAGIIYTSSLIVQKIVLPSFEQMIKFVIFSIVLGVSVAVMGIVLWVFKKLGVSTSLALKGVVTIVALSTAIMLSSKIIAKGNYNKFPKLAWLIMAGLSIVVFGAIIKLFKIMGLGIGDIVKGGIAIIAISGIIMISSQILNKGKYQKYPTLAWIIGVGLSLTVFGIAAMLLGSIAMADGGLTLLLGSVMVLLVAGTIVATSMILAKGKYDAYPPIRWIASAVLALAPFAIMVMGLGAIAMTGIGLIAFALGVPMVMTIADTIKKVSDVLAQGKYDTKGMFEWTASAVMLFSTFAPLILVLGAIGVAAKLMGAIFGRSANPFEVGKDMLAEIAWSIVEVSYILQKGTYKGGPTKDWSEGVSLAIGAFAPVYAMLMANKVMEFFGGGGVGPEDFKKAIITVSQGITTAALYFSENKSAFVNGPPKKWAKGVGAAIGAFAPVLGILQDSKSWFGSGVTVQQFTDAIMAICQGITAAAKYLGENNAAFTENIPPAKWGKNVGLAISAFAPVFEQLKERTGWFTSGQEVIADMQNAIRAVGDSLVYVAVAFAGIDFKNYPTKAWATGVKASIEVFIDLLDTLGESEQLEEYKKKSGNVMLIAVFMTETARLLLKYQKAFDVKLNPNFVKNIATNVLGFAALASALDKMLVTEKTITSSKFGGLSKKTETVRERRDLSLVRDVVLQMAEVAAIISISKSAFQSSMPAGYIKRLSVNVYDFVRLLKFLRSSGVVGGGGLSGFLSKLNPVSSVSSGMIELAKSFDMLARSLNRFSSSIKSIDAQKINMIRKLTANIAILSAMDARMFNNMLRVLETRGGVFAKLLDVENRQSDIRARSNVGDRPGGSKESVWKKKTVDQGPRDEKGETALTKLDRIADILKKVAKNTEESSAIAAIQAKSQQKLEKQMKKVAKNTKEVNNPETGNP